MDLLNNKLQHRTQWDAQQVTGSDVRVLRRACFGYETMTSTSCLPSGYRAPPADRRPAEHCGQRSQEGRGWSGAGHQPPDGALQPQAALSQFRVQPPGDVRARAVANRGARRGGRGGEERDGQRSALHRRGGQHTEGPRHPAVTQVCHARPSPSHDKVGKPPSSQLTRLFPQVDASHTARAPKQEGASDQRDLPAERRHCPAAGRRDAATLHQPIPARRHLTGNAARRALHQKNKTKVIKDCGGAVL